MKPITPEDANKIEFDGILDMNIQWINGKLKDGYRTLYFNPNEKVISKPIVLNHIIKIYSQKGWHVDHVPGSFFSRNHKLIFRERENYVVEDEI